MKKIKTYATGLFLILAGLLSSCIENNVPYPIIKLDITAVSYTHLTLPTTPYV